MEQVRTGHTPGPWLVMPGSVVSQGRTHNGHPVFVAAYGSSDYEKRGPEIDANARLIAQAPAMIEALEAVKSDLESLCTCGASTAGELLEDTDITPWACECPEPWAQQNIDAINAVIKQARGES